MSPERDASCEGLRLAASLAYVFARAEIEGLAAAGLARAERWGQGIVDCARLAKEEVAAISGDIPVIVQSAAILTVGLFIHLVDPEHGALVDLRNPLRRED